MIQLIAIALKDLKIAFRDKVGMIMLAGPFALTLAMGFVTGTFSLGDGTVESTRVAIVNQDEGELGAALVQWLRDESVRSVLTPSVYFSAKQARAAVDDAQYAAAVIVPADFSQTLLSGGEVDAEGGLELYIYPGQPIRAGIVRSMIERFVARVETGVVSSRVAVEGLIQAGLVQPGEAFDVGRGIGEELVALQAGSTATITVESQGLAVEPAGIHPLALLAPSMAMLFLMYTVTGIGGRSILAEREDGTLPRMLAAPTGSAWILGGKVVGTVLVGVAQLAIVIVVTSLLFQLRWGDTLGVAVLILTAVFGAAGWGILVAAFARTSEQVSSVGTALMLFFGLLGGSFFGGGSFGGLLGTLGKITPNAWAQEGFAILAGTGTLADIREPVLGLTLMGGLLFVVAVVVFRRRGLVQR